MKTTITLTAEEIQLIIDALTSGAVDMRWSYKTRAAMAKLKEELEQE